MKMVRYFYVLDIDGCLCPSVYANIKHDNSIPPQSSLSKALVEVQPFSWVGMLASEIGCLNASVTVITGRSACHNDITRAWLEKTMRTSRFDLLNVEWNGTYPTRDESYNDYVVRKSMMISARVLDMYLVNCLSGESMQFNIYEDDLRVIERVRRMLNEALKNVNEVLTRYLVVKDGNVDVAG